MDEKIAYWGSVIFSALALVLIITDISLSNANRTLQQDVSQRQSLVASGQQLGQLNQNLVQALAEAAYKNNNLELRDLLATQGITLKNSEAAPAAAPATKPTEKK